MKNIKNLLILSVTALAICSGITFTGCSSDSGGGDTSPTLITQWKPTDFPTPALGELSYGDIYCYDDGTFKTGTTANGQFQEHYSGTYDGDTLNDGEITFTVTKFLGVEAAGSFTATISGASISIEKNSITGNLILLITDAPYVKIYAGNLASQWEGKDSSGNSWLFSLYSDDPLTDGTFTVEISKENDTEGPIIYDGTNAEDLTFSFSFTIENVLDSEGKWGDRLGGVYIKWDQVDGKPFDNCIDSGYITAPKLGGSGTPITAEDNQVLFSATKGQAPNSSTDGLTIAKEGTSDVKVTVNYAFGWGAKFGGENPKNPAEYANDDNYTTVMSDLNAFKSALTNPNFTITIDAFLATAE